jgi:predicted O-methyltransferase YrrM
VGLAWLASGARSGTGLVSVEIDAERARAGRGSVRRPAQVAIIPGDWREIYPAGPFDLLVLDGGGSPADPGDLLEPGGTVVIDDLTPASAWPPRFEGQVDQARMYWLTHPAVDAAELRLAPDLAALVAHPAFPC